MSSATEGEWKEAFAQALEYVSAVGGLAIHCLAGMVPQDKRREAEAVFVDNLKRAADQAAAKNIKLYIEPINPRDMPGYLLTTQADAHAIRTEVGARNLKVQMDCYHAQIVEGDLTEKLRRYLPHIGHVQIAGVPGRHEPDVGEVNYAWIFKVLDEAKYEGYVGCEYRPATGTLAGLGWLYRLLDRPPRAGTS